MILSLLNALGSSWESLSCSQTAAPTSRELHQEETGWAEVVALLAEQMMLKTAHPEGL